MNKNIIILFALKKEANSLLNQSILKFKSYSKNEFFCEYNNYNITVLITGIGNKSKNDPRIINLNNNNLLIKAGTCAILDDNIPILTPIIPQFVGFDKKIIKLELSFPDSKVQNRVKLLVINKGLITVKKPLLNKKKGQEYLNKNFAACDMETFYLIEKYKNIPFIPLLVGTDRGDKKSIISFIKSLSKASEILRDEIIKIIKK